MAEVFLRRLTRWQAEQQREAIADLYVTAYREPPGAAPPHGPTADTGPVAHAAPAGAPSAGAGFPDAAGPGPGAAGGGLAETGRPGGGRPEGGAPGAGLARGGLTGSGFSGSGFSGGAWDREAAERTRAGAERHSRRAFLDRFAEHVGQPEFEMIIASTPTLVGFTYGFQADRARVWHPGFQAGIPPEIDELTYSRPVFSLAELCVLPAHRRQGIATRLVDQLLTRATGPLATATVDATNPPAQHAFASWGWSRTGALLPAAPLPDAAREPDREAWSRRLGR
ncbi:GNAT family N-acetyltransferase [Streptomyces buecherae]|uniref:GNAT family N-acetyltransferase n=1 Tax=Streptomyces buecherae TaxID=2763006 RepID=A0A7H8N8K1_9ACTN|nr:GNAT family N-acetyltransferase [Streptomyces buecherae]QKW50821.1 GNAT family N-acetyltransferase [Streptomyces buecherae]